LICGKLPQFFNKESVIKNAISPKSHQQLSKMFVFDFQLIAKTGRGLHFLALFAQFKNVYDWYSIFYVNDNPKKV
jgi:hypothetical protein